MDEQLNRTTDKIIADIRVAVTAKAKTDGYSLVIDTGARSATGTPIILYAAPADNDITDTVVKQLNMGAPMETPKADDKPASGKTDK
jgi:Skp family chaperone for outer membrane proteins